MVLPVLQTYLPENGDILYGKQYIAGPANLDRISQVLSVVSSRHYHPWKAVHSKFGIDISMSKDFEYRCPFSNNVYYWCVPYFMVVRRNDAIHYAPINIISSDSYEYDLAWQTHLWKSSIGDIRYIPPTIQAFLGHGYTEGTLPSDGSAELNHVLIELNNGDALLCLCWIWYNK